MTFLALHTQISGKFLQFAGCCSARAVEGKSAEAGAVTSVATGDPDQITLECGLGGYVLTEVTCSVV